MSSNFLDWERKYQKNKRKKKKFSIYEAIFIRSIGEIQPVESKALLKTAVMEAGLSEEEFILVFDILKRKKILNYTLKEPKGFYIEEYVKVWIKKEYTNPIKKVDSIQVEFSDGKNKTLDSFLKKDEQVSKIYEELGLTQEEMREILERWKEDQQK